MSQPVVLYDLGRKQKPNKSWSYNVWKARLVLNYKKIPYSTSWVDHNTIGPTLSALGLSPSDEGFPYTVPTVKLPDGGVLKESAAIAEKLESLHPTPSLQWNLELQAEADRVVHMTAMPLFAIYMPQVARAVIHESTVEAFSKSREARFRMSLDKMEETRGGEKAWKAAEPGFAALKALLNDRKVDEGPFILGSKVCYADFIIVAIFETLKRVGASMFERALEQDPSFGKLYEACQVWFENDE